MKIANKLITRVLLAMTLALGLVLAQWTAQPAEKNVHVRSYTKKDGRVVEEHYRSTVS